MPIDKTKLNIVVTGESTIGGLKTTAITITKKNGKQITAEEIKDIYDEVSEPMMMKYANKNPKFHVQALFPTGRFTVKRYDDDYLNLNTTDDYLNGRVREPKADKYTEGYFVQIVFKRNI